MRRESGIVYIKTISPHLSGSEIDIATKEAIHAAEMAGDRVIFVCADGTMSWFA
jgi:hypothetical protein